MKEALIIFKKLKEESADEPQDITVHQKDEQNNEILDDNVLFLKY